MIADWIAQVAQMDLENRSFLATIIGMPVGIGALVVGISTLRSDARTARLEHMHTLFTEYLKMQFEYNKAVGEGDNPRRKQMRANLGTLKMYTFEEMTLWLERERGWWLVGRGRWPFGQRRDYIDSWQATIDHYLDQSSIEDYCDVENSTACYGQTFRRAIEASKARRGVGDQASMPSHIGNDHWAGGA